MDYIDIYKKEYKEAYKREFSTPRDKEISKEFYERARKDIKWGKDKGLIKDMCMEDYIVAMGQSKGKITDKVRKAVVEAHFIPHQLLADYYGLHKSTISKIRTEHKYAELAKAK